MAKKKVSLIRSLAMKKSWAERRNSPMREQARKKTVAPQPEQPKGEPKFWILWCPLSNKPPKVRFGTLENVKRVAGIMVEKYHQPFYVMESIELHKPGKPDVVKYDGPPAKESTTESEPLEAFHISIPPKGEIKFERIPAPLSMQGQPWDDKQDSKLIGLWYGFTKDIRLLAERMGRSELAIQYRLEALSLKNRGGWDDN